MPKTLGEVLKSLAIKAGAKEDNENLVNELSAPIFQSTTLSDDLIATIDNGLLSIESAKNNHPDIKKHYTSLALNGLDTELNNLMSELGVGDDVKAVILNERSSYKRASLLAKKLVELESKKKNTDDKGEKTTLQNEINELRGKLRLESEKAEGLKAEYDGKIKDMHKQVQLEKMLAEYKTVYDELPLDARNTTLTSLISKTLQEKNAELKLDDNGQLTLVRKDGANVFGDDNRPWNPKVLVDHTLSQYKVLKVTDPKPANPNPGNNNPPVVQGTNGSDPNAPRKDNALKGLVNNSLKDLESATKVAVM